MAYLRKATASGSVAGLSKKVKYDSFTTTYQIQSSSFSFPTKSAIAQRGLYATNVLDYPMNDVFYE